MKNEKNGHMPYSAEAEQGVIGALLVDPDSYIKVLGANIQPDDFYIERNGWIYEAINTLNCNNTRPDLITLADELDRQGRLKKIGDLPYLSDLIVSTPTSLHIEHYAKIVKRQAILRQVIKLAGEATKRAHDSSFDPNEVIGFVSDELLEITKQSQTNEPRHISDFCDDGLDILERLQDAENGIIGIPTGLTDLDNLIGGLQPSNLYIVGGRPGMGKSALALQMAMNAAKSGKHVLYFSAEMSGVELSQRMVSGLVNINNRKLQRGPLESVDYQKIINGYAQIADWPIHIDDQTVSIETIRAKAIQHQYRYGLDLLVVDYIQLLGMVNRSKSGTRDQQIGDIANALKHLAGELYIPVVGVASLSRQSENRHNKRPMLSDLRESGNIEYAANVVVFLYRDEVYYPDSENVGVAELIVAKQRQGGATGLVTTFYRKETTTFLPLATKITTFEQI